jgi:hypothetical protein
MGFGEPKMPTAEDLAKTQQETGNEGDYEKEKEEIEARLAELDERDKELFAMRAEVFGEFAKTGALKPASNDFERHRPDANRALDQNVSSASEKMKLASKEGKEADLTDYERIAYEFQVKINEGFEERRKIANRLKELEGGSKSQEPEQTTASESVAESPEDDKLKVSEILERIKNM